MLRNEAAWLERHLAAIPTDDLDPLLDIGGGAGEFRDAKQPWIGAAFRPLEARGVRIIHHEFTDAPGVDVAGDLDDPAFLDGLAATGARAVICCNVLEHLAHRDRLLGAFANVVPPGGHLVVTVPHRFPYHADPIDTMYRPSVADLARALPDFELVAGDDVECGTLWRYLRDVPDARTSMVNGVKTMFRRSDKADEASAKPAGSGGSSLPYLVRQTSVTCAVLRRG
jgi:SAM-dependent methyltransferase